MEERTQLDKTMKPHWIWAIALGSAIGWGSFVLPADWMAGPGPIGAIIGFGIGGLLMILIAVSYGFLIRHFPVSGGEFAYAYLGFGRTHAYVCGWFLALGYMSIVALNASALALLLKFTIPQAAMQGRMYSIAGWDVYVTEVMIATAALLLFAWLNIRGASFSGRLQFIFCVVLVLGVAALGLGMFMHPDSSLSHLQPAFNPEVPALSAILTIVAIAPFAFVGFDNVPQSAEEFDFPAKKAFSLIVWALVVATIIYAVNILFTAVAMPWQDLVAMQSMWGTGDVVSGAFGNVGLLVLALAICMGIFTGLNGFFVSASRLLFAMSRARILPEVFGKLHAKHKTPYAGIIFTMVVCLVAPWFGRQVLLWIVDMASIGVAVAYFYTCYAAYRMFKWSGKEEAIEGAVSPIGKLCSLLGVISSLTFVALLAIPGSPAFMGVPSWMALIVWLAIGAVFYFVRREAFNNIPKKTMDYYIFGEHSHLVERLGHQEPENTDQKIAP